MLSHSQWKQALICQFSFTSLLPIIYKRQEQCKNLLKTQKHSQTSSLSIFQYKQIHSVVDLKLESFQFICLQIWIHVGQLSTQSAARKVRLYSQSVRTVLYQLFEYLGWSKNSLCTFAPALLEVSDWSCVTAVHPVCLISTPDFLQ